MSVLFVCTGNICRSPLAEAIARAALARADMTGEVASAGVRALVGSPASEYARAVITEQGLDLSGHRARQLTRDLVERACLVVAMMPEHAAAARSLGAREVMEIGPVRDPFFGRLEDYRGSYALLCDRMPDVLARVADRL